MLFLNSWVAFFLHLTMQQKEIVDTLKKTRNVEYSNLIELSVLVCLTWEQGL